ncbi:hypothetical protein KC19_1G222900 [Ceratodon purpureus]|uniref:C3H1-type domain-containing protein n=1 Tax=Ceratodon purpureus TaxID=3225 RepID=A0A8T0J9Z6_CERPU|nr:hypothetical protein KC19_1G222900 [Ceratodon purpureus]
MMAGMEVDDGPARVGSKRNHSRSGGHAGGGAGGGRSHINQVCKYWQDGRCYKGDECQWLHPGNAGTTGRGSSGGNGKRQANNAYDARSVIRDNHARSESQQQGGWGGYGGGGFSSGSNQQQQHGGQGRARSSSARWGRRGGGGGRGGHGQRDGGRVYGHEGGGGGGGARAHAPKQKPCTYWLKGNCTRGESCNFLHAHTTAPDVEMKTQLVGHEKAIRAIVLPEGHTQLYTGSQDETVRVWDCTTGVCANVAPMGGDVGALIYAAGWLFVGLPNEVKVRVEVRSLVVVDSVVESVVDLVVELVVEWAVARGKGELGGGCESGWGGVWNACRNGNVRDVSEGVVGLMVGLCELGLGVNWWGGIEMADREVAGCEHDDTASAESERAEGAGARACGDGRGAFVCGYPGRHNSGMAVQHGDE